MSESRIETIYSRYIRLYSGVDYLGQDMLSDYTTELYSVLEEDLNPSKDVLSVSMFDTLVFRGPWSNLCFLWGFADLVAQVITDELPVSVSDVFFARYAAERHVRATRNFRLDRTEDLQMRINTHTSINICGDERFSDIICELENHHLSNVLTRSIFYDYCIDYRSRGGRVVVCTDSIIGKPSIIKLLSQLGIDSDVFTGIYSSGDYKFKQASNSIYRHAQQDLCVAAANIFHVGHDFIQDFKCPREVGCRALWLPLSDRITQERVMNRSKTESIIIESTGGAVDIEWKY